MSLSCIVLYPYLLGTPFDLVQRPASFHGALVQLLIAVLDRHDEVLDDITVLLPAQLCQS